MYGRSMYARRSLHYPMCFETFSALRTCLQTKRLHTSVLSMRLHKPRTFDIQRFLARSLCLTRKVKPNTTAPRNNYVYIYIYLYMCICVCMYVYIYIYIYMYYVILCYIILYHIILNKHHDGRHGDERAREGSLASA